MMKNNQMSDLQYARNMCGFLPSYAISA